MASPRLTFPGMTHSFDAAVPQATQAPQANASPFVAKPKPIEPLTPAPTNQATPTPQASPKTDAGGVAGMLGGQLGGMGFGAAASMLSPITHGALQLGMPGLIGLQQLYRKFTDNGKDNYDLFKTSVARRFGSALGHKASQRLHISRKIG